MKEIKIFDYRQSPCDDSKITRQAARAVIFRGHQLLMVKLTKTEEYKFPGGGVEDNENILDALRREVMEEAGVTVKEIKSCLGYIDQIYPDLYSADTTFYMRSVYYLVDIDETVGKTQLSSSEKALGFVPEWVDLTQAINLNRMRHTRGSAHHWTERELYMLEYLELHKAEML